jgi:hypothetical protein
LPRHLRIARPVTDVTRAANMYCQGLTLQVLASFQDHEGFDGVMVGAPGADYHLEFTRHRRHPLSPSPTAEDLLVIYYPRESEWWVACAAVAAAGFQVVSSCNPYWDVRGRTYADPDGYRLVLQQDTWTSAPDAAAV